MQPTQRDIAPLFNGLGGQRLAEEMVRLSSAHRESPVLYFMLKSAYRYSCPQCGLPIAVDN